jgi:hypothetical protein
VSSLPPFGHTAQESEMRPLAVGGGEAERGEAYSPQAPISWRMRQGVSVFGEC